MNDVVRCPSCAGQGEVWGKDGHPVPCPGCDGTGEIKTKTEKSSNSIPSWSDSKNCEVRNLMTIEPGTWSKEPGKRTFEVYRYEGMKETKPAVTRKLRWWERLSFQEEWTGRFLWPWQAWKQNADYEIIEEAEYEEVRTLIHSHEGNGSETMSYTPGLDDIGKAITLRIAVTGHERASTQKEGRS